MDHRGSRRSRGLVCSDLFYWNGIQLDPRGRARCLSLGSAGHEWDPHYRYLHYFCNEDGRSSFPCGYNSPPRTGLSQTGGECCCISSIRRRRYLLGCHIVSRYKCWSEQCSECLVQRHPGTAEHYLWRDTRCGGAYEKPEKTNVGVVSSSTGTLQVAAPFSASSPLPPAAPFQ